MKFGYEKVTSGAASDIEQVTRIARAMVTEWGLSDKIGPIAYKNTDHDSFMPGIGRGTAISPDTARMIEEEIKGFVTEAHETALAILKKKKKDWYKLAEALLEYETLSGDEIRNLLEDDIRPKRPDLGGGSKKAACPRCLRRARCLLLPNPDQPARRSVKPRPAFPPRLRGSFCGAGALVRN